jgi:hypothetical protein
MKRHPNRNKPTEILIDDETAAILEAINDMPDAVLEKLVQLANTDPKAFAEFAETIRQPGRPEIDAIIELAKDKGKPRP